MGVTLFRPGARLIIPGVQVMQTRAASVVSGGWWDNNGAISGCVAAYAAKGAADLAASYMNLANPGTFNAAPGVAPTFNTADGWTFNGTTQYLTSGVLPVAGYSLIMRYSNASGTGFQAAIGTRVGATTNEFMIFTPGSVGFYRFGYGNNQYGSAAFSTSGVIAITPTNYYVNGSSVSSHSGSMPGTPPAIFLGAYNNNGSASGFWGGKIQAVAIYNTSIVSHISTLTTAMNAL